MANTAPVPVCPVWRPALPATPGGRQAGARRHRRVYRTVTACQYQCLRCRRTFRLYPTGVKRAPTSQRVKALAVTHAPARSAGVLYLLGLSYGAVALALDALRAYLCKSQVAKREAVQAAAKQVPGMKRRHQPENDVRFGFMTAAMMRILAKENFPADAGGALRERGQDFAGFAQMRRESPIQIYWPVPKPTKSP